MSFYNITPFCMVPSEFIGVVRGIPLEVWLCLADWDDTGKVKVLHPKIETIAKRLGYSYRAITKALGKLQELTDRLERINVSGEANIYRLNMTKRESEAPRVEREKKLTQGRHKRSHGVGTNVPSPIEVVNKNLINNLPPTPHSGGEREISIDTIELHAPVTYSQFSAIYPRVGGASAAQRAWIKLNELEKRDAIVGAKKVSAIYKKAPKQRLRFTQTASKWLNARAWETTNDMLESHFEVPDFFADLDNWTKQKQLTKELQEWETVRWAELADFYKNKYPVIKDVTNFDEIPKGIRMEINMEFNDCKSKWLTDWHNRAKAAALAESKE